MDEIQSPLHLIAGFVRRDLESNVCASALRFRRVDPAIRDDQKVSSVSLRVYEGMGTCSCGRRLQAHQPSLFCIADSIAPRSASSLKGLVKKAAAPCRRARERASLSALAVTKITG